jgi:uroporphyrinogen-III synthase
MHASGDRPLRGKRVLITRAGEQSESFARALRARGAQPIVAPTIAIRSLWDLSAADDAMDNLSAFSWIVFTSQNGVDVFVPRLRQRHAVLHPVNVAAIGPQTACRLRDHGMSVALTAEQHVSEALARELVARIAPGERILLVRALEGREILATMLEDAGAQVTTVAVYQTVTANDPAFAGKVRAVDSITFTSASTVRGFSTLLHDEDVELLRGKCIACIGPVTAEAARRCGLHVDVVASHYTTSGLLDALEAHYGATV